MTCPLSKSAMNWLNEYMWKAGPKLNYPSKKIVNEFKKYRPKESIFVFRGVRPEMLRTECIRPRLKSYAHIEEQAIAVGGVVEEYRNLGDEPGILERRIVCPRDILIDTALLPDSCKGNIPPGGEVVVCER